MDNGHVCRGSVQRPRGQGSKTMISSALFVVILFQAQSPKAAPPIDLTGYWVSVVTQDWRWRMVTPAKGDYAGVPITLVAKKVGDAWDPAQDEAAADKANKESQYRNVAVPIPYTDNS